MREIVRGPESTRQRVQCEREERECSAREKRGQGRERVSGDKGVRERTMGDVIRGRERSRDGTEESETERG